MSPRLSGRPSASTLRLTYAALALILLTLIFLACASSQSRRVRAPGNREAPPHAAHPVPASHEPNRVLADATGPPAESIRIDRTLAFGIPRSEAEVQILENEGFTVGYSNMTRTPLWVGYRLFANPPFEPGPRPSRFLVDTRVANPVRHDDYSHTGYDRGHMAPNAAIARCYGDEAQRQTFLTTNIIPQLPGLNQRGWEALESLISNEWAQDFSEVWVFTGPIFEGPCVEFEKDIAVPSACYMLVIDIDDDTGDVEALGVIMEQRRVDAEPLERFVSSIDAIEARTGIDFLHELDDTVEDPLESGAPDDRWELSRRLQPQFPGNERAIQIRDCN